MEMNKQRKMLIGVLALGLGGLGLDRLVLAPPESASADDGSLAMGGTDAGDSSVPAIPGIEIADPVAQAAEAIDQALALPSYASLTERLIQAQTEQAAVALSGDQSHDPFALPDSWQGKQTTADVEQPTGPGPDAKDKGFLDRYTLDGTFISGSGRRAVISGRAVRRGQTVEGYRLARIEARWVSWQTPEGKALVMQAPDALE